MCSNQSFSARIDGRIFKLEEIRAKASGMRNRDKGMTITISREYGCPGFPLALHLKELLENSTGEKWTIYDKQMLEYISVYSSIDQTLLHNLGDSSAVFDLLSSFVPNMITHSEAFQVIKKYIEDIAHDGNAIIVGRGGAIITKDYDNCVHLRIEANHDYRINYLMKANQFNSAEAEKDLLSNEQIRENFISKCLGENVRDPKFYDMVFNAGRLSVEEMSQLSMTIISKRLETFRRIKKTE